MEERRRRTAKRVIATVIAAGAVVFSLAATVQWLRPSVAARDLQFARVERGSIEATLQASGVVVPAVEEVISSPVEARVLRIVRRPGDRVVAGDELVALDTAATRLDADRLAGSVAGKVSEQTQLRLKIEETVAALRAQIEQKKLDGEILHYKAEQNATLHKAGLVSAQDDLAAATTAKKCEIELAQLREALGRAQRSGEAQLAATAAELSTLQKERDESRRQLDLAMMRADRQGVVTAIVQDAGATVRKGDVIARIADLSAYRVDATISDVHAGQLAPGMRVRVKVDDGAVADGTISGIEPRIESGAVKFHVALDQPSRPSLRNNLRVDVYVVTGHRDRALRLRRGALGQGESEEVFVRRDGVLRRVRVRWGLAGDEFIEPLSGVRDGDDVVISNMNDYSGINTLRLR